MAVEAGIPTLITVITTAAIDSINPCAIGVLILMISVMIAGKKSTKKMLLLGSIYVLSVLIVYLLSGLGLVYFFLSIPLYIAEYVSIAVGTLITLAGLIEIKDFFWYGKYFSLSINPKLSNKIHKYSKNITVPGVIVLGVFVSAVELPCTGAPYLAIITLLAQYFDFTAFLMLVLYNIVFVAPLIIILLLAAGGMKLYSIKKWKEMNRHYMRLLAGLLLIFLGWLLILIANGTINLG